MSLSHRSIAPDATVPMLLRALVILGAPLFATGAGDSRDATPALTQITAGSSTITSTFSAEGLTLRITAVCPLSGSLCPFRAEIDAAPAFARRIQRVEYTYVPDRRTAPSANTNSAAHFRFEGSQHTGELVYANVFLAASASRPPKRVLLEAAIPFSVPVSPPLPVGLRFEDSYQMQYLEGAPTDYFTFRVWLRGEPEAFKRIKSVDYHLPEQYFSRTTIRATKSPTEYFMSETASSRNQWDIVAVIRWTNGRTSRHSIPFRPQ